MKCPNCNVIEMTQEEEVLNKCMSCTAINYRQFSKELGVTKHLDPDDFGRTQVELNTINTILDQKLKSNLPNITKKESNKFMESTNTSTGLDLFNKIKMKKIKVYGQSEDVTLTLEIPDVYTIRDEYWTSTQNILVVILEYITHYLAFGPMAGKPLEEYLAEKFLDKSQK